MLSFFPVLLLLLALFSRSLLSLGREGDRPFLSELPLVLFREIEEREPRSRASGRWEQILPALKG